MRYYFLPKLDKKTKMGYWTMSSVLIIFVSVLSVIALKQYVLLVIPILLALLLVESENDNILAIIIQLFKYHTNRKEYY